MITKLFHIIILCSVIGEGANIDMNMFDINFFRLSAMVLFIAALFDTPKRMIPKRLKIILSSLLGLGFFSAISYAYAPTVLHNLMNMFIAVLAFSIVYVYYDEKSSISKWVLWGALINVGLFTCQQIGFDPVFDIDRAAVYAGCEGGLLGNSPRLATYLALATPMIGLWFVPIVAIYGLYTNQFAVFIPVVVMLLFWPKKRWVKIAVLIALLAGMAIAHNHIAQSLIFRFNMSYRPILTLFFDKPFMGYGLGQRIIPELEVMGSSYLQLITGAGIMAVVWFWYALRTAYKRIDINAESMALITLALLMLIEYPIEIPRLWFLIIGILATFSIKNGKCYA